MANSVAPRATVSIFTGTAIAVVLILVLWVVPGFLVGVPNCPVHANQADRSFCAEVVQVGPGRCAVEGPCPVPTALVFQGVLFQMQLANVSGTPYLYGFVNESNGETHNFGLVGNPLGPPYLNWTSPDDTVLIAWHAPFPTTESDGLLNATVTCGVYLP